MTGRYKLRRRSLYMEEEREFKNIFQEFIWMMHFKVNGWKIEKISSR